MSRLAGAIGALQGYETGLQSRDEVKQALANTLFKVRQHEEVSVPMAEAEVKYKGALSGDAQARAELAKFQSEELGQKISDAEKLRKKLQDIQEQTGRDLAIESKIAEIESQISKFYADKSTAQKTQQQAEAQMGAGVPEKTAQQQAAEADLATEQAEAGLQVVKPATELTLAQIKQQLDVLPMQTKTAQVQLMLLESKLAAAPLQALLTQAQVNEILAATTAQEQENALNLALEDVTIAAAKQKVEAVAADIALTQGKTALTATEKDAIAARIAQDDRELLLLEKRLAGELASEGYSDSVMNKVLTEVAGIVSDMTLNLPKTVTTVADLNAYWNSQISAANAYLMSVDRIGVWKPAITDPEQIAKIGAVERERELFWDIRWWGHKEELPKAIPPQFLGTRKVTEEEKQEHMRRGVVPQARTEEEATTLTPEVRQEYVDRIKAVANDRDAQYKIRDEFLRTYSSRDWDIIIEALSQGQ